MAADDQHPLLVKFAERVRGQEGLELEFKKARGGIPHSVWPTVSSFANTNGGWVVFGVDEEQGEFVGVKNPHKMMQDMHNQLRNSQKISHPVCGAGDLEVDEVEGAEVLIMRVPAVSRKDRPVYIDGNPYEGTYVRRNEGDFLCSKQEVDRMMREASGAGVDSTVLPHLDLSRLDEKALSNYRQRFQSLRPGHPWNGYGDDRFLEAIDAVSRDSKTGERGVTVAGLLMFGESQEIRRWRSRHLLDYRVISSNGDEDARWDDRITWEGNLLGAFEAFYQRLTADQPVRFRLQSGTRVDESSVHIVLREALVNLLVHADYAENQASLIQQSEEGFLFRNPGSSLVPKDDLLSGDRSEPRNPALVRMFRLIGLAEEAGTGISQIVRLWREQGLQMPKIDPGTERYEFVLELRYSHLLSDQDRVWLGSLAKEEWSEAEQLALVLAKHQGEVRNRDLQRVTGLHSADLTKMLSRLKDQEYLEKKGRARGTYYVLGSRSRQDSGQTELPLEEETSSIKDKPDAIEDRASAIKDKREDEARHLRSIASPARENRRLKPGRLKNLILLLCGERPLSISELADLLERSESHLHSVLRELLEDKKLSYVHPESPRHPNQKYRTRFGMSREPTTEKEKTEH